MGDLTEMVPFEALDGTKRMARWDMYASRLVERLLREEGLPAEERNFLTGVELGALDTTKLSAIVYAQLASADHSMGLPAPRLSWDDVVHRITPRNTQECLVRVAEVIAANAPEPAEPAPRQKRAGAKRKGKVKAKR